MAKFLLKQRPPRAKKSAIFWRDKHPSITFHILLFSKMAIKSNPNYLSPHTLDKLKKLTKMSNYALKSLGHRKIRLEILVSYQVFYKTCKLYEEI